MTNSKTYPKLRIALQATLLDENNNVLLSEYSMSNFEPTVEPGDSVSIFVKAAGEELTSGFAAARNSFNNCVQGELDL